MGKIAYYNEFDQSAAAWLLELARRDLIPRGEVDAQSIEYVAAADVVGFAQCHFFAGIGGWPYALRLAGWPDDRPVWTGSCPCQPLSCAGKRQGEKDERHLWPEFYRLISECRPPTVFGEQVASADGYEWVDGVSLDLEEIGYAVATADLPAACVAAPHRRQRLFWVAAFQLGDTDGARFGSRGRPDGCECGQAVKSMLAKGGTIGGIPDTSSKRREQGPEVSQGRESLATDACRLGESASAGLQPGEQASARTGYGCPTLPASSGVVPLADTERDGGRGDEPEREAEGRVADGRLGAWSDFRIVACRDIDKRTGKQALRRVPVEPAFFAVAPRVPSRVVRLRGYGNAIVPQVAAEFVKAFLETEGVVK